MAVGFVAHKEPLRVGGVAANQLRSTHKLTISRSQAEAGRGDGAGGHDTAALGAAEEGGRRTRCNVSHLPENQVCGRCWPYMPLLQYTMLRQMRWKSYAEK